MKTPLKPEATSAMKRFKMEVANELGIADYENMDKGNLSSRENGYVGGNMTKKMVAFAEQNMAGANAYGTQVVDRSVDATTGMNNNRG
jgi:hypothetical protein